MVIIAMLVTLLLPAVQKVRENARVVSCSNNLKQIGLAIAGFEAKHGYYPPSSKFTPPDANGDVNGWSAHALLLPYLEQNELFVNIDFERSYEEAGDIRTADGVVRRLSAMRIPTYICPSEPRDEARISEGQPEDYPLNYAVNLGTWFVYDPRTGRGGNGVFYPGARLKPSQIVDGLSYTLGVAEVKAWNAYYRNAALSGSLSVPAASEICTLGGDFKPSSGHTEWVDGRAHQTGFTTTFGPNAKVACEINGATYDVDWSNQQEGKSTTVATYAAVTARSHHAGGLNAVFMDGSVRWFANDIPLGVWRAFSTRDGHDVIPSHLQGQ